VDDPEHRDDLEAAALYDLLEGSVAPRFYDHDERGLPTRWLEMVRHTLATLGPKVLASRMVADYVTQLYVPASASGRSVTPERAAQLSQFRARVRGAWPGVRVDHVDSAGVSDTPQVGDEVQVKAFVSLGSLSPDDVDVQVVFGRVTPADTLGDTQVRSLSHAESYEAGRHRYEGSLLLRRTGPFGYTVRVLPKAENMVNPAELGLVANA
jgi:starch phosphorylase